MTLWPPGLVAMGLQRPKSTLNHNRQFHLYCLAAASMSVADATLTKSALQSGQYWG